MLTAPTTSGPAREQDELHDWERISDEDIETHSSVLCFMDDEGLRFHLPAYMRFTLRRYRESESLSTDSTIYRLSDPECMERLLIYLTDQQVEAIKTFLTTCLEIGEDWLDISNVPLALRGWQGDEEAAGALQAVQAATRKQVAALLGLAPELHERYLSGDLTEEERQHLPGQLQVAATKCGPSGGQPKSGLWSRALVMLLCVAPFMALSTSMHLRRRGNGMWWLVGVCAIGTAFVAFLLDLRRNLNS